MNFNDKLFRNGGLILFGLLTFLACNKPEKELIRPIGFEQVEIKDNFWKERIQVMNDVTVPFALEHGLPAVKRLQQCADFRLGRSTELPEIHRFISSDLYKCLESAAYSLVYERRPEIEAEIDRIAAIIAEAQQDDGYLYVDHICHNPRVPQQGDKPYSWIVHSHELYNVGHLYEAAAAYYTATGKDNLLKIAEKSALHVNKVIFEGGDPNYNDGKPIMQAPGHEEIELGLCKLYKVTGKPLYLDMAKKFLDIRGVTYRPEGTRVMSPTYAQQQCPVRDQRKPVGHAVRAGYLYAAMAEVDALTNLSDYKTALDAIWTNLVETKTHITGGLGAVHGIEGFGEEYDLPNKNAYNETCAAIANVFFNHKMFLSEGDAKYLDIMELSIFNNSLAGIGLEGKSFFYENPLECDGIRCFNKGGNFRAEWFGCACCPPNVLRLILQAPGYMYAHSEDKVYMTLYASSAVSVPLKEGAVKLDQTADYPYDGEVKVTVNPAFAGQKFDLCMRIPTWAQNRQFIPGGLYTFADGKKATPVLKVNGEKIPYTIENGFAHISRAWQANDIVELSLPMETRFVACNEQVEDNHNRLAVTRGPLVYCAEASDNADPQVQKLFLDEDKSADVNMMHGGLMEGIRQITLPGHMISDDVAENVDIHMIPYYAWNNRTKGNTMVVWLPEDEKTAFSTIPGSGYLDMIRSISATSSDARFPVSSICDGGVGASSKEMTTPSWASKGVKGQTPDPQEVVIEFKEAQNLSSLSVYWMDRDEGEQSKFRYIQKVPQKWAIECRVDGQWKPMELYITDSYETRVNQYNTVHPNEDVICDAVKVVMTPYEGYTLGIAEVQFTFVEK